MRAGAGLIPPVGGPVAVFLGESPKSFTGKGVPSEGLSGRVSRRPGSREEAREDEGALLRALQVDCGLGVAAVLVAREFGSGSPRKTRYRGLVSCLGVLPMKSSCAK